MAPPSRCPKCDGHSWDRFTFPRSLLMNADNRAATVSGPVRQDDLAALTRRALGKRANTWVAKGRTAAPKL
jgi:hypothetical protein